MNIEFLPVCSVIEGLHKVSPFSHSKIFLQFFFHASNIYKMILAPNRRSFFKKKSVPWVRTMHPSSARLACLPLCHAHKVSMLNLAISDQNGFYNATLFMQYRLTQNCTNFF